MELAPYEPRVTFNLHNFHKVSVWRGTDNFKSVRNECFFVLTVELVTVTMPLRDFHFPVSLLRIGTGGKHAWVSAEPHRAAEVIDAPQFAQLIDHPMLRGRIKLRAVRICQSTNVPGKFNHAALHSQTNAKEWNLLGSR